ncbi:flagellar motor switch protein FliN [uncultured Desulfovibrio sp.]|uniref:flagellar motor switch protein FliN n=1 Tax=uncultured Desulfovibrio sp. TaxID=167968 RepID=UPI0026DB2063|nr:flagellar motor switch protein FliN [uncultured Desulfovibrio sp.]
MAQDDQEALAAQWAAELEKEAQGGDAAPAAAQPAAAQPVGGPGAAGQTAAAPTGDAKQDEEALAAQWAEALAKDEEGKESAPKDNAGLAGHATDAHFQDMTEMARQPGDNKLKRELDFILDIPLDVSAELGRTRLLINELLQPGQGSVVELNKLAGEPLEVYVNGKLVARGEAVVINEKFGVRLTDIISPIERVKQLG